MPDKFKGTLSAGAAAAAIARGWRQARPDDLLKLLPMSDGGDGFGAVVSGLLGGRAERCRVVDAAHRPCEATWWWEPGTETAIVESALVVGLAMLPPGRYHPFELDTAGLGGLLEVVAQRRPRRCLVGIGGSATNDGGFGLARALGWTPRDAQGAVLERWTDLERLAAWAPFRRRRFRQLVVAVDVRNLLLGVRGATRVYGPQKGLHVEDFAVAERCLRRMARLARGRLGCDFAREPGAGAAGGLGFGFRAFLGARLEPGFDLFARYAKLNQALGEADLVVTGEGSLDASTLMGKGVGRIAEGCRRRRLPCLGLAGTTARTAKLEAAFSGLGALTDLTTPAEARQDAARWLETLTRKVAGSLKEA